MGSSHLQIEQKSNSCPSSAIHHWWDSNWSFVGKTISLVLSVSVYSILRDPFMVLSGGLSYDTVGRRACLTVMHGKSTTVLEMDYPIVDFLTLCETPYPNGEQRQFLLPLLHLVCNDVIYSVNFVLCLFARLPGALCCRGPPGERFSCNRPRTDWVNILFSKYSLCYFDVRQGVLGFKDIWIIITFPYSTIS